MTDQQTIPTEYSEYEAYMVRVVNSVSCPNCRRLPGDPCIWKATNTGTPHTPRVRKYQKVLAR